MRHAIRAPEPPPRPLDDEERDNDERDDFGKLLPNAEEEALDEDEDDPEQAGTAGTLDDFDLDPPLADVTFEDLTAPDMRFGHDSVLPEEEAAEDDDAGGFAAEPRAGEALPEDEFPADQDDRDGIDDARQIVSDLDLPGLDADDEELGEAVRFGAFFAAAELAWPSARRPWRVTALATERANALALHGGTVVAGSTDLLWLDPSRTAPVRIALDGTRIVSLALLGDASETVVAVTALGRVLRRARLASDCERIGELGRGTRSAFDLHGVELCALGRAEPRSLLLRSPDGSVGRSDDAGAHFTSLEPPLRTAALTSSIDPLVALGAGERELLVSSDRGRTFERRKLEGVAGTVARGEAPLVAAAGELVVLVDSELGLVLSTDGGRSFREVPGSVAATACAAGSLSGRAYAWLALYSEAADSTRILMVDPERAEAEVIATVSGSGDDEALGSSARIERLAWDGTRLFAAGDTGFLLLEPPSFDTHH